MANSYVEYTTAGSGTNGLGQTTFTAPTKFLSINDIRIKGYNGSTWTELTISSRGTTTVTLSAAPTAYSKIRVFRSSTTEALIDFQNGSRLAESDLDIAYRQSLFVAQEVAEDADPEGGSGIGNIVSSQLANVSITNSNLAGGITNDKLAGGITDTQLASGVGTNANNLVKLDGTAKLPAVDGSQLTNVSAGKVLQVLQSKTTSAVSTTQTSFQTTGLSVSITPSATTSNVLLRVQGGGLQMSANQDLYVTIYRGSTNLGEGAQNCLSYYHCDSQPLYTAHSIEFLDTGISTTSATTYTVYYRNSNSGTNYFSNNNAPVYLTAMEIAP